MDEMKKWCIYQNATFRYYCLGQRHFCFMEGQSWQHQLCYITSLESPVGGADSWLGGTEVLSICPEVTAEQVNGCSNWPKNAKQLHCLSAWKSGRSSFAFGIPRTLHWHQLDPKGSTFSPKARGLAEQTEFSQAGSLAYTIILHYMEHGDREGQRGNR